MSALKHVILQDKDQDVEKKLDWSYIEWAENEVPSTGVANAETQTDTGSFEHKECQTSNPVIMHIDLTRSHSKLRHLSMVDSDSPFFQFDRQAPGRISTSPTLRRMRSTRRPLMDAWDPVRMGSTHEELSSEGTPSPISPLSPLQRVKSPLAARPLSDVETCRDHKPISSSGQQRTRSYRSKTFDNGITSNRAECCSTHPTHTKKFGFLDNEVQVSLNLFICVILIEACLLLFHQHHHKPCVVVWWGHISINLMVTHSFLGQNPSLPHTALPPAVVIHNASFWQQMNQQLHALTALTKPTAWRALGSALLGPLFTAVSSHPIMEGSVSDGKR